MAIRFGAGLTSAAFRAQAAPRYQSGAHYFSIVTSGSFVARVVSFDRRGGVVLLHRDLVLTSTSLHRRLLV